MKRITPYSSDGNPSCFSGDLSLATGVAPAVVIVLGAGTCRDSQHGNLGVVFFDSEPVMWTCLSDGEISRFHDWGKDSFGVRVIEVRTALASVNCPPPMAPSQLVGEAAAEMRSLLRLLGAGWLASAPAAPKPAA
jgi:hypothetical protein